jgi:hypothetical protein
MMDVMLNPPRMEGINAGNEQEMADEIVDPFAIGERAVSAVMSEDEESSEGATGEEPEEGE